METGWKIPDSPHFEGNASDLFFVKKPQGGQIESS
jgi:hypothetical protein